MNIYEINDKINNAFRYEPNYSGFRSYEDCLKYGAKCYDYARHKAALILKENAAKEVDMEYMICRVDNFTLPHSVLLVYDEFSDDPFVLDSIDGVVKKQSERLDLEEDVRISISGIPLP